MADDNKKPEFDHESHVLAEWAPRINMWVQKLKSLGHIPSHVKDEDLHDAGREGLMDAFHRYNRDVGDFGAFANHRIRGKMLDHVAASGGTAAVDKLFRDQARAFNAKQSLAGQQTAPTPDDDDET